jgi:hypothetical protein
MATGNAINANSAGIVKYDGAGTFSSTTITNHSVLVGGASNAITSIPLTNGQVLIGSTGADPVAATITAGTGITTSLGAGTFTINSVGGGLAWNVVTGSTQTMISNNGYIANRAGTVAFTLPTTSAVGDIITVTGINTATGWSIAYTTNQQIFFGISSATLTSGSLASTAIRDTVTLVCVVANLSWNVISSIGNITVA